VDIVVQRTIKAGQWSTICLPFAMTEEQTKAAFGDDVQLMDFVDYETVEDDATGDIFQIIVNFEEVDLSGGFEANHPYVIKVSGENDITEFEVNSTIEPDEEDACVIYDNGLTGKKRIIYGWFQGTYHAQTVVPENGLFISNDQFWYSTGLTKMKAFRAYFEFDDVLTSIEDAGTNIAMNFEENQSSGISEKVSVKSEKSAEGWHTVDGRRLNGTPTQKGVYIKNGKKIIIK
jgi:hypothetical protein